MTTTWDEASRCPTGDGFTGVVQNRRGFQGGQLVTLSCPATRCQYNLDPWVVQIRPDNTIPDKIDPNERRASRPPRPKVSAAAAQRARDLIAQQVADEQKPGTEVQGYR